MFSLHINLECQKNTFYESVHILTLICTVLGRLRWSLNEMSVLFNLHVVSKSLTEMSTSLGAVWNYTLVLICPV